MHSTAFVGGVFCFCFFFKSEIIMALGLGSSPTLTYLRLFLLFTNLQKTEVRIPYLL